MSLESEQMLGISFTCQQTASRRLSIWQKFGGRLHTRGYHEESGVHASVIRFIRFLCCADISCREGESGRLFSMLLAIHTYVARLVFLSEMKALLHCPNLG